MSTAPLSFAQMPNGKLLLADGLNPMQRWDGFLSAAQGAGVAAPASAVTVGATGLGAGLIKGSYYVYTRFVDGDGNPSNLSPLSNLLQPGIGGATGTISGVAPDTSGQILITATAHGLQTNDVVILSGVTGATAANGTWTITVVDVNSFLLQHSSSVGLATWSGGGTWLQTALGATITKSAAPTTAITFTLTTNSSGYSTDQTFNLLYTFRNAQGATTVGPTLTFTLTALHAAQLTLPALPLGVAAIDLYYFLAGGTSSPGALFQAGITSTSFLFNPAPRTFDFGPTPPTVNTCTLCNRTSHGLTTGALVLVQAFPPDDFVSAVSQGSLASSVVRVDANTFVLQGLPVAGLATGLVFTAGASTLTYANVPVPTDPKVTRRQVFRNTDGQTQTFYLDVDSTDLVSTSFTSTRTDSDLANQLALPLLRSDGSLNANRYDVPPANKAYLCHFLGRMFAAGEVLVNQGNVQVTNASATVTGIGTAWTASLAGRFLYVRGASQSYQILSVNTTAQTLTLTATYADTTDLFAGYGIRPPPAERLNVVYSEPGFPEAWPPTNGLTLQEDGDEITGLCPRGSYLYILQRRFIHRFTFESDPAANGAVFLAMQRGCLNNRCWAHVENLTFMLDEQGIHAWSANGSDTEPLSHTIQDVFRVSDSPYRINWADSHLFHVAHYPQGDVLRWFVVMAGTAYPQHAIAYNYRDKRWWIEAYNRPITASATGRLGGAPQMMAGSDAATALALWQGTTDGPDPKNGTVRGTATAATLLSLTDSTATFPTAGVVGNPVVITAGRGKGQVRRVASVAGTTLSVKAPWAVLPDTTSQYQLGGIVWQYRSGDFRYLESEEQTTRHFEVVYGPCQQPATATVRLYEDLGQNPTAWGVTFDSAAGVGVASTAGSGDLVIDLTKKNGFVQKRLDRHRDPFSEGSRFIGVDVSGVTNADPAVLFQIQIDGAFA